MLDPNSFITNTFNLKCYFMDVFNCDCKLHPFQCCSFSCDIIYVFGAVGQLIVMRQGQAAYSGSLNQLLTDDSQLYASLTENNSCSDLQSRLVNYQRNYFETDAL